MVQTTSVLLELLNRQAVFKMSACKHLAELTLPMTLAMKTGFLVSQKIIQEKLTNCYAEDIASVLNQLVVENCNGCIIDHPSQRQHPCLMMESDERLSLYFDVLS